MSEDRAKELRILEKVSIECRDVDSLISDYIDQELLPTTYSRVAKHLGTCDRCKENEEDMLLVINLAKTFQSHPMPQGANRRLREHLNNNLGLNLPLED